jgi:glutamate dehydrogenase/leucine dehydrogenase
MASIMPLRSVVFFAPGGMDRRMEQSALTHIFRGTDGNLPMGLAGHRFDTPLKIDRFDQWAAEQVVSYLRDPSFSIPAYLRPLADQVCYSEGVKPKNDELSQDLVTKLGRTIDALPDMSEATKVKLRAGLLTPAAVHIRILQIPMDDGSIGTFLSWRVQDNRWNATDIWTGGGLRESTDMGTPLCHILASGMTLKNILQGEDERGLGFGGAKGGIACDPEKLSLREQKRLLTAYSYAHSTAIAMYRDKPAGDIGTTDSRYMDWLQQGIDDLLGPGVAPGSFTGKTYVPGKRPRDNGTPLRGIATGLGCLFAIDAELQGLLGWETGNRVFVQGAGNAGLELAIAAAEAGYLIAAINDRTNAWIKNGGLTPDELREIKDYKAKKRPLESVSVPAQPSNALLERLSEADIFVPAGKHRSVDVDMIRGLRNRALVVPMANHPYTPEAGKLVAERELEGNLHAPHYSVTSGGGVASSSVEARQNLYDQEVTEAEEREFLRTHMVGALTAVEERRRREGVSSEDAALREGLYRLAAVMP